MNRYIAFDVETPNHYNNRISAIGITVVEDGRITDSFCSLVNPETYFDRFNIWLTGISPASVIDAPAFPELWERICPIMESGILVAHNANFDIRVLQSCLMDYGINWRTSVKGLCTVLMGRRIIPDVSHKLDSLCGYYGICLNHHHADSDSRACAEILLRYMETGIDPVEFLRTYNMR